MTTRARLPRAAFTATAVSAAMIAQQVAGKAARDALFLTSFKVVTLPFMMVGSAVLSLLAVLWLARLIVRHTPQRVVPASFLFSGIAFFAEWGLSGPLPRVAAVVLYLHTTLFGASIISAFWSLINETFDPHTSKRAVSFIAGGGTFGGILGGALAWRAAALLPLNAMLPLLGVGSLLCFAGATQLGPGANAEPTTPTATTGDDQTPEVSPFTHLRSAPYLRNLALVVGLGALTSGLLDYVFSSEASLRHTNGAELLRFFSQYGLIVGVISFVLQTVLGRVALEKLGLAVTVALLPGVVVFGGALGLAVPGLASASLLRGAEATQRNSLFRAAYELLYTPLSEQKKRSTKTLIDVGFDRLGTILAGGVLLVVLAILPHDSLLHARANATVLVIAIAVSLFAVTRSRRLHRGYVAVLEESLRKEAEAIVSIERTTRTSTLESREERDAVVAHFEALPGTPELTAIATGVPAVAPTPAAPRPAEEALKATLSRLDGLDPRDPQRLRELLKADGVLPAPLIAFAILLLEHDEVHHDALVTLRRVAGRATGQLVDALCDPESAFAVRRRIPRVLASCRSPVALEGLLRGTNDARFEVRYECGRALWKLTDGEDGLRVPLETVIAVVKRETEISKEVWESQPASDLEADEEETPSLIDRLLRDRIDRSLEHVFTILALHVDRDSLRIAFKALHADDDRLRGTALEYLETVLPDEVRDAVWPFLGEARPMRARRPAKEILEDLSRLRSTLESDAGAVAPV